MLSRNAGCHVFLATVSSIGTLALAYRAKTVARLQLVLHTRTDRDTGALEPLRWTEDVSWRFVRDSCI
jgi:hypothetical protein